MPTGIHFLLASAAVGIQSSSGLIPNRLIATSKPTELDSRLFLTGEIPRVSELKNTGGAYFTDSRCSHTDPILPKARLVVDIAGSVSVE